MDFIWICRLTALNYSISNRSRPDAPILQKAVFQFMLHSALTITSLILSLALLIPATLLAETNQPAATLVTVVRAGHLLDPVNGRMLANQLILIEGEVIKEVAANITIPEKAKIIDL